MMLRVLNPDIRPWSSLISFCWLITLFTAACSTKEPPGNPYSNCATCEANLLSYTAQLETYEIQTRLLAETLEELNKNYSKIEKNIQTLNSINQAQQLDTLANRIVLLFENSHNVLDSLSLKIGASAVQSESVSRIIGTIRQHLWQQENLFVIIYTALSKSPEKALQLRTRLQKLNNTIPDAVKNPVHYIIDSPNNLLKYGIIKTSGNIMGKGATYQLADSIYKLDYFITKPMASVSELVIPGKGNHQLVTRHSPNSYRLVQRQNDAVLYITKPSAFWGNNKLLVIATEE